MNRANLSQMKLVSLVVMSILLVSATASVEKPAIARPSFSAPILKWQLGGCYNSWCETGWYSSPATADLDGDGQVEVIASTYSIFVLNGSTGELEWQMSSGHDRSEPEAPNVGRTWPGIVIVDLDNDGEDEIVTAHSGGTSRSIILMAISSQVGLNTLLATSCAACW